MKEKPSNVNCTKIAKSERRTASGHHHRGKSSERLLDKQAILAALKIAPGQTVLDAGCGNGYMAKEFSKRVGSAGRVYALDPDEDMIAALRTQTSGTNIVAVVGDITLATDLPASSFDLVYLSTVVHGFSPDMIDGLKAEVGRVLAPHGRLAIVEIVKRETPFGPPMDMRFSPQELRNALGLSVEATLEVGEYFYLQLFHNSPSA